jgi:hypothetical protein
MILEFAYKIHKNEANAMKKACAQNDLGVEIFTDESSNGNGCVAWIKSDSEMSPKYWIMFGELLRSIADAEYMRETGV